MVGAVLDVWAAHVTRDPAVGGEARKVLTPDAAAEAELSDATPLRDNGFKVELAKRTIVAVLGELTGEAA